MWLRNIQGLYIHDYYLGVPPIQKSGSGYLLYLLASQNCPIIYRVIKGQVFYVGNIDCYHQKDIVSIPNTRGGFREDLVYTIL
jgi:hypothetical protein